MREDVGGKRGCEREKERGRERGVSQRLAATSPISHRRLKTAGRAAPPTYPLQPPGCKRMPASRRIRERRWHFIAPRWSDLLAYCRRSTAPYLLVVRTRDWRGGLIASWSSNGRGLSPFIYTNDQTTTMNTLLINN